VQRRPSVQRRSVAAVTVPGAVGASMYHTIHTLNPDPKPKSYPSLKLFNE